MSASRKRKTPPRRKSASKAKAKSRSASRSGNDAPAARKRGGSLKKRMERLAGDMVDGGIRLEEALDQLEKCFLQRVLAEEGGNQTRAASRLQLHRNTLRRKLERHGLN